MAVLWHTSFLVLLAVFSPLLQYAKATCFWPDGSVATGYIPCNSTVGGASSACCGADDICSTHGYCMGTAGFRYRGGCTDNDWNSANCAVQCKQVAVGSFSNIYPCPEHPGSYPVATDWCCGATEGTAAGQAGCCNTSNSKVDTTRGFGPFFIRDYNRTEPVSSSTATTTVTSSIAGSSTTPLAAAANTQTQTPAPATTPLRPSSTKRDVAIGLGVGVPIAVLALALLGFLLLREHRRRTHAEKTAHDIMEAKRQSGSDASLAHAGMLNPPGIFGANGQRVMPELSSDPISLNELQSRPIYEAGS